MCICSEYVILCGHLWFFILFECLHLINRFITILLLQYYYMEFVHMKSYFLIYYMFYPWYLVSSSENVHFDSTYLRLFDFIYLLGLWKIQKGIFIFGFEYCLFCWSFNVILRYLWIKCLYGFFLLLLLMI